MTGLRMVGSMQVPVRSNFHVSVFKGRCSLNLNDIGECESTGGGTELCLRLAFLYIIFGIFLRRDRPSSDIQLGYLHLIDNLDVFLAFPWGKVSYDLLVCRTPRIIQIREVGGRKLQCEAIGYVCVSQVWANEVMPDLARFCAIIVPGKENQFSRIIRWQPKAMRIFFDDLLHFFQPSSRLTPLGSNSFISGRRSIVGKT